LRDKVLTNHVGKAVNNKIDKIKSKIHWLFWDALIMGNPSVDTRESLNLIEKKINKILEDAMNNIEVDEWEILKEDFEREQKSKVPEQCRECEHLDAEIDYFANQELTPWCQLHDDTCKDSVKICEEE